MNDLGSLEADLVLAATKVENALISARVAERAALDATAALERIQTALRAQRRPPAKPSPPAPRTPLQTEPLNVRPREAQRLLGCGKTTVFKMMDDGRLESFKRDGARLITMESIRAAARGGAPE